MNNKRLTFRMGDNTVRSKKIIQLKNKVSEDSLKEVLEKLAEYEETDLSPDETIQTIKAIKLFYKEFPKNIGKSTNMMPLAIFESKTYKSLD